MAGYTDSIIRIILIIFFVRGCLRGIGKSLQAPIALIIGSVISITYYQATADLMKTILISLFSPIVIGITLGLMLKLVKDTSKKDQEINPLSRLGGGIVSIAWNGVYLCLVLIFISIFPSNSSDFQAVQNDVLQSQSFAYAKTLTKDIFPVEALDVKTLLTNLQDIKTIERLQTTDAFKRLMRNKQFADFLSDETITKDLMNQDISKVLSNPKLQSMLKDKDLLQQLYDLNKEILNNDASEEYDTDYNYFSNEEFDDDEDDTAEDSNATQDYFDWNS